MIHAYSIPNTSIVYCIHVININNHNKKNQSGSINNTKKQARARKLMKTIPFDEERMSEGIELIE